MLYGNRKGKGKRVAIAKATGIAVVLLIVASVVGAIGWLRPLTPVAQPKQELVEAKTAEIRIGTPLIADGLPVFMAVETGIFETFGLKAKVVETRGSGPTIEGLLSDQFDVGMVSPPAVITFAAKTKTYLKFLTTAKLVGELEGKVALPSQLIARKGVVIKTPKDFEGKSILTNALGGPNQVAPLFLLKKNGVDVSKVKWKELSFPQMPVAIAAGEADVASVAEPFASKMLKDGSGYAVDSVLGGPSFWVTALGNPALVSALWTTPEKYSKNPELFKKFVAAVREGVAFGYAIPEQAIKATAKFTKTDVDIARTTSFATSLFHPYSDSDVARLKPFLEAWVTVLKDTEFLKDEITLDRFFA